MTRKLILTLAFVFATTTAAIAEGTNFETIYNPNTPDASADEGYSLDSALRESGRRELLHFDQPWNRVFGNDWFGNGLGDGN